jgi:hypothetical protein
MLWSANVDGLEELTQLIQTKGRRVYVAEQLIDLSNLEVENVIYILQLPDGSTAAGGRGGGLGERRIVKVYHYRCGKDACDKMSETEDDSKLDSLDLPYHATSMPIKLPDGKEVLVSGVVDPTFVSSYEQILG